LIEFGEELVLGFCDGVGADGGNFSGGLSFMDGTFGLGGEEGAVGLRVSVALGHGGSDAGRADPGWGRRCDWGD
jgi:hypothetical protein